MTAYYVDPANGNNANSGLSWGAALKNDVGVQAFLTANTIVGGDTIIWALGTSLVLAGSGIALGSTKGGISILFKDAGYGPAWADVNCNTGQSFLTITGCGTITIDGGLFVHNGISAVRVTGVSNTNSFNRIRADTFSDSIFFYLSGNSGTGHSASMISMLNGLNDGYSIFGNGTHTLRDISGYRLGDQVLGGGQGDGVTTHETGTIDLLRGRFVDCSQGGVTLTNTSGISVARQVYVDRGAQYGFLQSGGGTLRVEGCIAVVRDTSATVAGDGSAWRVGGNPTAFSAIGASTLVADGCTAYGEDKTDGNYMVYCDALGTVTFQNGIVVRGPGVIPAGAGALSRFMYKDAAAAGFTSDRNCYFNIDGNNFNIFKSNGLVVTDFPTWKTQTLQDANSQFVNPLLRRVSTLVRPNVDDPGSLRPLPTSPCRGVTAVARPGWATGADFLGRLRPYGTLPDQGAYEWTPRLRGYPMSIL